MSAFPGNPRLPEPTTSVTSPDACPAPLPDPASRMLVASTQTPPRYVSTSKPRTMFNGMCKAHVRYGDMKKEDQDAINKIFKEVYANDPLPL